LKARFARRIPGSSFDAAGQPLVSVVVPCFGQTAFLPEAVESALRQTHPRVEVLVVDDAAPDGADIARVAHEFGVRLLRTETNLGPAGARDLGIRASSGTYVLPLDADDILAPDFVAKAVRVLEGEPAAGVCYCKLQAFGAGGWTWEPPPGWSLRELLAGARVPSCSLFRRACWEQVGGYGAEMRLGYEDWDFWVALAVRGWRFVRIPEYLAFYRRHAAVRNDAATLRHAELLALIHRRHGDAAALVPADEPLSWDVDWDALSPPAMPPGPGATAATPASAPSPPPG
jgi:glycosyltransferase involved in cell wall biosynthesis